MDNPDLDGLHRSQTLLYLQKGFGFVLSLEKAINIIPDL